MGLFGKTAKDRLSDAGFVITETLFEAPRFSMAPSLYQDSEHYKWAIALPGMEPAIHGYEDIVDCKVTENRTVDIKRDMSRKDLFESILENPAAVSRANASKKGKYCTRLDIALTVRGGDGRNATMNIPLITREISRSTKMYVLLREGADELCRKMLGMRDAVNAQS